MAWNKPSEPKVEVKGGGGQRKVYLKGVLVGAVAVVVGVVCIFAFSGKSEKPVKDTGTKPAKIKEVTPAPAPTNAVAQQEETPLTKDQALLKRIRDKYGDDIPPALRPTVYYLENPPQKTFHPNAPKYPYLKHRCERTLASILAAEPGALMIRQPKFDERFDADFLNAAVDKIQIEDDDADDVREVKNAVQQAKEEIIARVKNGEKASDILNEEAKTLYELGMYRHMLEREIGKVRFDGSVSDSEVQDYVDAANKMLAAKGAKPIKAPNYAFRKASLAAIAKRKAQQENAANQSNAKENK